jgi:hypothetical protein
VKRLSLTIGLFGIILAFAAGSPATPPPGFSAAAPRPLPVQARGALVSTVAPAAIVSPGMGRAVPAQPAPRTPAAEALGERRFMVRFRDQVTRHRVMGVFLLPGEDLNLESIPAVTGLTPTCVLEWAQGEATQVAPNRWRWTAPQDPGLYPVKILDHAGQDSTVLNMFVMVPADRVQDGQLNRYRIGHYPRVPLKNNPLYNPPPGFVEITAENEETLLAPHFKLKQFACKQEHGAPKYVVLQEQLLLTLEAILEELNRESHRASTLHIMSGYRTPYYNEAIGNVKYSCHQWGVAADIFVDADGDEMMDDLNQDGRINEEDASVLVDIVEAAHRAKDSQPFSGGLARYKANHAHGPFVHVDVRGVSARWGI